VARGLLGEEVEELGSAQPQRLGHVARAVGDRDLEDSLCDVDGDASTVLHDGLLLLQTSTDSGTSMPIELVEESIPSLAADGRRAA
jgi:hypothetical protein